jgi:hypothetical protein
MQSPWLNMKAIVTVCFAVVWGGVWGQSDVIISQYIETNSGTTPKGIEVFNISGAAIDFSVSNLEIRQGTNGASCSVIETISSGTLNANEVWVIGTADLTSHATTNGTNLGGTTNFNFQFNGDDAIQLLLGGVLQDEFGICGSDPGSNWSANGVSTENNNLQLKDGICDGDIDGWTDPSIRFDEIANGSTMTGFGDAPAPCTTSCIGTPATGPSVLNITGITSTTANIGWTVSPDFNSMLIARENTAVAGNPIDGIAYTGDADFGNGSPLGGGFVGFSGFGNSVSMAALTPGSDYYVNVLTYCINGLLYNTTDILSGHFLTEPENPSFNPLCSSSSSITLSWDNPTDGSWDGFVILGREGDSPTSINSVNPESLLPNPDFGLAPVEGVNSILYAGNGNSEIITGLTPGSAYTFKILAYKECATCINPFEYSTGTQISATAILNNVSNFSSTPQLTAVELGWDFNAACADEVIVVASETPITGNPSGPGPYFVNSPSFTDPTNPTLAPGEFVIFSGLGNTVTVTNLTTDVQYCFKSFLRSGSTWSNGVSVCETPREFTVFEPGDLSIIAINSNTGSGDEVCFISYRSITLGTSIDLTDNGYERVSADLWGDTEGVIRLERTGGAIAPGTTICMQGSGYLPASFSVLTCGEDDGGWSVTSLNGNFQFDLNADDQVWIMQGGNWINPAGSHDAVYTGNVLYGWTAVGWQPSPGYASTVGSTLFPNSTCLSTDLETLSSGDKVKYTGPMSPATKIGFLQTINNEGNWTGYTDNTEYFSEGPQYSATPCILFDIVPFSPTQGEWTGIASADWFDCRNWENLQIPDETVNVSLAITPEMAATPVISNQGAECNDLLIDEGMSLTLSSASSTLNIGGDVSYNGYFYGNNGTVSFVGSEDQLLIRSAGIEVDFVVQDMVMNKPSGRLLLSEIIQVNGVLNFQQGNIELVSPDALVEFTPGSSTTDASNSSFVDGKVRKIGNTEFIFPIGDVNALGIPFYQPARIFDFSAPSTIEAQYFAEDATFTFPSSITTGIGTCDHWVVEKPNSSDGDVKVALAYTNPDDDYCNEIGEPNQLRFSVYNSGMLWDEIPSNGDLVEVISDQRIGVAVGSAYGPFVLSSGSNLNVLPITLLSFTARATGKNLVETEWSTASETNNDYFTVERSRDAAYWEPVGIVMGAGNSNAVRNYAFPDDAPYPGLSYYRLKQTDFDGSFAYSHTVPVQLGDFGADFDLVKAYRDGDKLALLYTAESPQIYVELYSVVGHKLLSINAENSDGFLRLDLPQLAHGVYIVRISSGTDMATAKFFY